jgi:3-hydroxyacyl-CoA dehydrogenase
VIISENIYKKRQIGVAVVGSGRMGSHRARLAALHSAVNYLVVADTNEDQAKKISRNHKSKWLFYK